MPGDYDANPQPTTMVTTTCPEGERWEGMTQSCVGADWKPTAENIHCPIDMAERFEESVGGCVSGSWCPPGQFWDSRQKHLICRSTDDLPKSKAGEVTTCEGNYYYVLGKGCMNELYNAMPSADAPIEHAPEKKKGECDEGLKWNKKRESCVSKTWCKPGMFWDSKDKKCKSTDDLPADEAGAVTDCGYQLYYVSGGLGCMHDSYTAI